MVGGYRTHSDAMQVVSGPLQKPIVHFEAPPSVQMQAEMSRFLDWFAISKLPALSKAALAHLYFVTIHPCEDGNGRIARALSEKVLAQALGQPSLITHLIAKTKMMERLRGQLNPRQEKALIRMFEAGPEGFLGGLSAKNYMTITDTTPATARRGTR